MSLIQDMTNFQLLEYLKIAVQLNANSSYITIIQEEIFCRMEVVEA